MSRKRSVSKQNRIRTKIRQQYKARMKRRKADIKVAKAAAAQGKEQTPTT